MRWINPAVAACAVAVILVGCAEGRAQRAQDAANTLLCALAIYDATRPILAERRDDPLREADAAAATARVLATNPTCLAAAAGTPAAPAAAPAPAPEATR